MKLKLKSLAVALAMLGAGAAQASIISDDQLFNNSLNAGNGTGEGDIFFAIYDPVDALSLVVNLDLTVNDFRFDNASLIDSFSVTNSVLKDFIAGVDDTSQLEWNLGGLSNNGLGANFGVVTTNGSTPTGAGAVMDATEGFTIGDSLISAHFLAANIEQLNSDPNPNPIIVGASTAGGFQGGSWSEEWGGWMQVQNHHLGLIGGELMTYINVDPSNPTGGVPVHTTFSSGQWVVDGALGKVSYVSTAVVPVPAAVWLLGSGLLGLVGVARRRS